MPNYADYMYWIMTLKKRLRPIKKNSGLRHVSRKMCVKIVALEKLTKGFDAELTRYLYNSGMPRCYLDFEWIRLERHGYAWPVPNPLKMMITVYILEICQC